MMKTNFSKKTIERLQYYVYAYIDQPTEKILYIGRGNGNRAFSHMHKYFERNINFRIDILRHGLTEAQSIRIESTLIDLLGVQNLDNKVKGSKSKTFGRTTVEDIEKTFGSVEIDINTFKHSGIFFFAHGSMGEGNNHYDSCRQFWNVSFDKVTERINGQLKFEYAFLMKGNFVEEVYKIMDWFPAGETHSSREYIPNHNAKGKEIKRFEFIGQIAETHIQNLYKHKSIVENSSPMLATQHGFKYLDNI